MSEDSKTLHFVRKRNYQSVVRDKVVRLRYAVFEQGSDQALAYDDDLYYLHGGYGGAFPRVEQALEGLGVDAKMELELTADEAYGRYDPDLCLAVPASEIPEEAHYVGARLEGESPEGGSLDFTVTAVEEDAITVDGNHPLAGRDLRFVLEVLDIRDATPEELEAGYAFPSADED
ncbi:FKBP-type peptidyl-prolyl cis-trans isomerase [Thiohalobacter sp. COW1]|uniref:FKBP-type peptidyl-prolyl cis-trans isomerase n=1 Tax=Thiohalobacter sp. COW1 TaxID=2795687 RepID=UPI001914EE15|nr:hypothetical protein [Thiohalobacter sp. COW1]BCO31703.1 FKBP-type peptidyl-prolyl cis-trans isomerase [Thiohalobacter sp. COW1]